MLLKPKSGSDCPSSIHSYNNYYYYYYYYHYLTTTTSFVSTFSTKVGVTFHIVAKIKHVYQRQGGVSSRIVNYNQILQNPEQSWQCRQSI